MAFPRSCGPWSLIHHSTPSAAAACNQPPLHTVASPTIHVIVAALTVTCMHCRSIFSSRFLHTVAAPDNKDLLALTMMKLLLLHGNFAYESSTFHCAAACWLVTLLLFKHLASKMANNMQFLLLCANYYKLITVACIAPTVITNY